MQNVLFKISEPTAAQGPVEFFTISISLQDVNGQQVSIVQESHGWWSNETRTATIDSEFRSPAEGYVSFGEAVDRYCSLKINRAKTGFVHSFSWHRFVGLPRNYKRIEVPVDPQFQPPTEKIM